MRAPMVTLLALVVVLAGCMGNGDDAGTTPNEAATTDGTSAEEPVGDDATDDDNAMNESATFEPETHSWDGVIPVHVCDNSGNCTYSPTTERDDSNTFEVSQGATLASFNFTWDDPNTDFVVHVGGAPVVDEGVHVGPPPFQFEVVLDDSGALTVSVYDHGEASGSHMQGNNAPFHMELVVS